MIACPVCGGSTRVLETRATPIGSRRRRTCLRKGCGGRVTSFEIVSPAALACRSVDDLVIVKRSDIQLLLESSRSILLSAGEQLLRTEATCAQEPHGNEDLEASTPETTLGRCAGT